MSGEERSQLRLLTARISKEGGLSNTSFEPDSGVPLKNTALSAWNIPEPFGNGSFNRYTLKKYLTDQCANKASAVFSPTEICALHMVPVFFRKQMEKDMMVKK